MFRRVLALGAMGQRLYTGLQRGLAMPFATEPAPQTPGQANRSGQN
jgi:hypothetical protein